MPRPPIQDTKMTQTDKKILTGIAAYVLVATFAFGWFYNHTPDRPDNEGSKGVGCAVAAAFWPVTITAAVALQVTRWP